MKNIITEALIINPKQDVFFSNIQVVQKEISEMKTNWIISSVCNSERRRFNLTKSHHDSNSFV